ncbi:hypothetical protein BDK51DRAFT_41678 [Blyttiomyces helicus]|uniref:Arrestin C-terminal-like domain-containing protein n=1 Tax=Blyttiomyces helicus TaxID=388810 RepID=A0A4P9WNQ6_9FUNG|nr:hypothetical protein BDK51DRAFT_41678 [Blyttiomyces helicus]|eukprot:RKO92396.1 hypothetical protein BDK51DRAFT_41678 [Blyttiomyces helicus]
MTTWCKEGRWQGSEIDSAKEMPQYAGMASANGRNSARVLIRNRAKIHPQRHVSKQPPPLKPASSRRSKQPFFALPPPRYKQPLPPRYQIQPTPHPRHPTNAPPSALAPAQTRKKFIRRDGTATITIQTNQAVFIVGEHITVDVKIANESARDITSIHLTLHQTATLKIKTHEPTHISRALKTIKLAAVETMTSRVVSVQLRIPYATPTVKTKSVEVSYRVVVRLAAVGEADVPIDLLAVDEPPLYDGAEDEACPSYSAGVGEGGDGGRAGWQAGVFGLRVGGEGRRTRRVEVTKQLRKIVAEWKSFESIARGREIKATVARLCVMRIDYGTASERSSTNFDIIDRSPGLTHVVNLSLNCIPGGVLPHGKRYQAVKSIALKSTPLDNAPTTNDTFMTSVLETFSGITQLNTGDLVITSGILPALTAHTPLNKLHFPLAQNIFEADLIEYLTVRVHSLQELGLPRSFAATCAFLEILPSACPKLRAVFFGKAPTVSSSRFKKGLDDAKPPRGALKEVHIVGGGLEGLVSDAGLRWTAWDGSGDWGLHVGELVGIVGLD